MELNNNLVGVQGVLVNCLKQTGEFTRINYRGGNEDKILYISSELLKFLTNKGFLEDNKPKEQFKEELNEIVFFLALNTVFKKKLLFEDYSHLMNIFPQLSKCLLATICFGLDLVNQYGYVIEKFPLETTEELLDQMIECLRKGTPKEHLDHATVILKAVANKLSAIEISDKIEDTIEDVVRVVSIILKNMLNLSSEDAKNMTKKTIYLHMGYTLLDLFALILYVNENLPSIKPFLECVLYTTGTIIKCVTLNVFCAWAEVEYEDQPLQTVIAEKAYLVVERYQKNKLASELVSMLSSIARKPKSISELILEADIPTIIKRVNEKDVNQKMWFRALLSTPIFQNAKIVNCIDRWWNICDESDIDRLLTVPLPSEAKDRQLIVKCACNLTLEGLYRILTIYFHREKFVWNEDTQEALVRFFNQIQPELSEDQLKQVLILMLQNAKLFYRYFYTTAFKNSSELVQIFVLLKDIAKIDHIGREMLLQVFDEHPPTCQTIGNYLKLLDTMLTSQFYSWEYIVFHIVLILLDKYRSATDSLEEFCCCLQILKHFDTLSSDLPKEIELLQYMLVCASENRCISFFEFNGLKEEITQYCVDYILKKCVDLVRIVGRSEDFSVIGQNLDDPWTNYYKSLFVNNDKTLLDHLLPDFNLKLYKDGKSDENFTRLLKVLPRCVSTEWRILLNEIENNCGFPVTLNALTDIMILLCDITESQGEKTNKIISALKFSLQNYGRFLCFDSRSRLDQILAINDVCRVLRHIPDLLKPTEGMSLITILPNETLRSLAQDKDFVARIVVINDKQLCKVLAQKVLGVC